MNIVEIKPGARESARGYPGATRTRSNASQPVSNEFKRGLVAVKRAAPCIGREKIALIHVARRDLQMADDSYRAMLGAVAGVTSSKDLTEAGFLAVMARFERLGFKTRTDGAATKPAPMPDRIGMATAAQLGYIRGLWRKWLGRDDEAAMVAWIEKRYHVSAIRFLDVVSAQKAIEGLKRMVERKPAQGADQ